MKQIKKGLSGILALTMCISVMTGCAANPDKGVVTSKNDGVFEQNMTVAATAPLDEQVQYSESFTSTDGTVEYIIDLQQQVTSAPLPIVEVGPHYITGSEAQQVAYALFGDVPFYEWQHWSDEVLSKFEIQDKITRWSKFTNQEAIDTLWGFPQIDSVPVVKKFIEEYTTKLETAPDQNNKVSCRWELKKAPYYLFSAAEAASYNMENEDDMLKATTNIDGIPFTLQVGTRNKDDYKANYIKVYIDSDSPLGIDKRYFTAQLCRTEKPTTVQVEDVISKVENILGEMELGEWVVDRYEVIEKFYGGIVEYIIDIRAVPEFAGIPALYQAPISNLAESDVYASNYQMSNIQIQFSANGNLIYFAMDSPIDIKETINENVAVITMDDMLDLAKNNLIHSSFSQYDVQMQVNPESDTVKCIVTIHNVKYTLARIRVPNSDENYYYVPSLSLYGDAEFYNKTTGDYYFSYENLMVLSLNAVDGTIINNTNI